MIRPFFEGCDMHLSPAQWCRCCDGRDDRDIPDDAAQKGAKKEMSMVWKRVEGRRSTKVV
jgi:hypothetical protein